jgi:hypothetical protein
LSVAARFWAWGSPLLGGLPLLFFPLAARLVSASWLRCSVWGFCFCACSAASNEITIESIASVIQNHLENLVEEALNDPEEFFKNNYGFWRDLNKTN